MKIQYIKYNKKDRKLQCNLVYDYSSVNYIKSLLFLKWPWNFAHLINRGFSAHVSEKQIYNEHPLCPKLASSITHQLCLIEYLSVHKMYMEYAANSLFV